MLVRRRDMPLLLALLDLMTHFDFRDFVLLLLRPPLPLLIILISFWWQFGPSIE